MAINPVQFQEGLSMVQFMTQYGSEAKCYRALYRARWLKGFRCRPARTARVRAFAGTGGCTTSAAPAAIKQRWSVARYLMPRSCR